MLASAERIVAEQGLRALTLETVCLDSGVSRAGFARAFASREELLLALHDELAARVRASMYRAYVAESSWLDGVRAAIAELLATLEGNIELARFILLDCAIDDGALPARRAAFFAGFAKALERDRPALDAGASEPPFGGQAMVGAVVSILHGRLAEDPVPPLGELTGPLTGLVAMPYLGASVARTELVRSSAPASRAAARSASSSGSPLPPVRVTIRTLATLRAIAERPGLSNAAVARAAGIADPGQVSKLLARLRSIDLIECEPGSDGRPVGKAWRLTDAGRELLARTRHAG